MEDLPSKITTAFTEPLGKVRQCLVCSFLFVCFVLFFKETKSTKLLLQRAMLMTALTYGALGRLNSLVNTDHCWLPLEDTVVSAFAVATPNPMLYLHFYLLFFLLLLLLVVVVLRMNPELCAF